MKRARVNKMNMTAQTLINLAGLVGTLLVGGMKFGALDSRVNTLEQRKDPADDVATVKAQVQDIKTDVSDVKSDVRDIKRYMLGHPK